MLKQRINSFVLLVALICSQSGAEELIEAEGVVLQSGPVSAENEIPVERTENRNRDNQKKFFGHHLKSLTRLDEDKVLFRTSGRIAVSTDNGRTGDFVAGVGDSFNVLDDHGTTEFMLEGIGEASVTIHYRSEFHHGSFGDNKITIDEGTIEIEYKNPE